MIEKSWNFHTVKTDWLDSKHCIFCPSGPFFFILPNSNIMYLFFPCATQLWANGLSLTKLSIWWETIHYTMLACLEVLGGSNWPRRPCEETGEEPGQMVGKILSCGKQGIWLVLIKDSFKGKWYLDGYYQCCQLVCDFNRPQLFFPSNWPIKTGKIASSKYNFMC